jgi:hypothetical protein
LNLCAESIECLRVGHEPRQSHTQGMREGELEPTMLPPGSVLQLRASVLGSDSQCLTGR